MNRPESYPFWTIPFELKPLRLQAQTLLLLGGGTKLLAV